MFRDGMRAMLTSHADMHVVGEADDGKAALALVRELAPRIVVMDLTMQGLNGIDATYRIRSEFSAVDVIALSMHAERHLVHEMLQAGASGYLLKECAFDELVLAIRVVCERRQVYLSPEIAGLVVDEYLHPGRGEDDADSRTLTQKERIILQLVADGKSNGDMAKLLHISTRTVEKHRYRLMSKLDIHGVAGLVRYAIREGITKI
jgi:DNA-binding NarL/FixJ family response regulator